jgi:DnaJ domain
MAFAFQYRPKFVDIRVRPTAPEAEEEEPPPPGLRPGQKACDHAGCRQAGESRAPKSRDMPGEYYWFCRSHAAEYNRAWNYFAGMNEAQIRESITTEQTTGGRPTWAFASGARNREAKFNRGGFTDSLGLFGFGPELRAEQAAFDKRLGKMERGALVDLGLDATASAEDIRERYIELVKLCHPDTNGGDRSAEHKLQRVLNAYKTLKKAKLV